MEPTMIAIHGIRPKDHMFGAHKIHTILQMIKARIYGVLKMGFGTGCIGSSFYSNHTSFLADARITSSGTILFVFHTVLAPACEIKTGFALASITSRQV